jgi:hypothetical protein
VQAHCKKQSTSNHSAWGAENPRYSAYRLGENSAEILSKYDRLVRPHLDAIESVVGALGTFPPEHLELVATIHFIHHRLKGISGRSPDKASVLGEFRRVKGNKFSSGEIESFYEALRRARLI